MRDPRLRCVVLVLPDADDRIAPGEPQPVEQVLGPIAGEARCGTTGYFAEKSGERGPVALAPIELAGHYNIEGNAVLARFVARRIAGNAPRPRRRPPARLASAL